MNSNYGNIFLSSEKKIYLDHLDIYL